LIGQTISHYKILDKLGEGGMGVVYKAEDTKLDRPVALKFLPNHLLGDEEIRKRFEREAKAAAALSHANVCKVYEIDTVDGTTFIAMEFIEGESLDKRIENGPLKLDDALDIAQQAAKGLEAAHKKGVVHRDVKPQNIIVGEDGHVTIMDFGLAQLTHASLLTRPDQTLGTTFYMSPEQTEGSGTDNRTDIWALGVVLYETVTGQRPFKGDYDKAVMYSILNEEPEPITALRTGVPMELEVFVGKCLAKDAANRYQNADDLIVDLRSLGEKLKSGRSIVLSVPAAPAAQTATPSRRNVLFGAGAAAVAAAAWFLGRQGSDTTVEPEKDPSVAVMPFLNSSGDPDFEYFSDGMTDELINALGRVRGLRVVGRTSVFQFKGQPYDIGDVAVRLGVSVVLEGTVRKAGERLRITAQLIDAADGFEIWSDRFETEMKDVFDVQDEICRAMVSSLQPDLLPAAGSIVRNYDVDPKAYELYLRGRHHLARFTAVELQKGREYLEEAIEIDPNYPLAHLGLSLYYSTLGAHAFAPSKQALSEAEEAVGKALEIDDSLALAHAQLGQIHVYRWEWSLAATPIERALELNPDLDHAYAAKAALMFHTGSYEEAIELQRRSIELDPLSILSRLILASIPRIAGDYEVAIQAARQGLEIDERNAIAHSVIGAIYIQTGRPAQGLVEMERARKLSEEVGVGAYLVLAYIANGRETEARQLATSIVENRDESFIPGMMIAQVYFELGEADLGFEWLEQAYRERQPFLPSIRWWSKRSSMQRWTTDPRFDDLLRRMNVVRP